MNTDTLAGTGKDLAGKAKQTFGEATGDRSLQGEGIVDQFSGSAQKVVGAAKDAVVGKGPLVDEVKRFAKERPVLATTLAGILGVALLNTLRGK